MSPATPQVANRLNLQAGDPVVATSYLFYADHHPIQMSESWEPASLTKGTAIELPEDVPAQGVIARMDLIGKHVDHVEEKVTARAATRDKIEQLKLPHRGSYVLVIERTHYAATEPVETCDIIFPGNRYELTYQIPVNPPPDNF
jgi:DNA-binding GntR family transcriptional regulator